MDALAGLVFEKTVDGQSKSTDRYGRTLGTLSMYVSWAYSLLNRH
jgi:endonuclease YncB( thermonuclease family)